MLGLSVLLLSASCVPPQMLALAQTPPPAAAPDADPAFHFIGTPKVPALLAAPMPTAKQIAAMTPDATVAPAGASLLPSLPNDATPAATRASPALAPDPAAPFVLAAQGGDDAQRALDCLTAAVYYEARSEPVDGQRAVAQVVLNRVRSPSFPNSVCGVVYQGSNRSTGCQFTFTCDGSLLMRREPAAWDRSRVVAQAALAGSVYEPVGSATFYHANYVSPWWAPSLSRVAQIGSHIFYRWPGIMGSTMAFNQHYSGVEPDRSVANGSEAFAMSSPLSRFNVDGTTITVHRGPSDTTTARSALAVVAGVRVHTGAGGPAVDPPAFDATPASDVAPTPTSPTDGTGPA